MISNRCEALNRFTGAYARLARLPAPKLQPVRVADWIDASSRLEQRLPVRMLPPVPISLFRPTPISSINCSLISFAMPSMPPSSASKPARGIDRMARDALGIEILVDDEGHGIANTANLFVPFFTTKPGGSGIGLFLSRQIAEAHGGTIQLKNRTPGLGCRATITLPA